MKKQIFILVIAIFASVVNAFGQATNNPAISPVPLTCATNDPLAPIAGKPYTYNAVINPVNGQAYWYATKSTTFTTAGARVATEILADGASILATATNYRNLAAAPSSPTSTIVTWTSSALAGIDATTNPLFMVVEYAGPTCSNNLKVMQIIPINAFTVDITNMLHAATPTTLAYGTAESQCFDLVQSAAFVAGQIQIDYGKNFLYYEVIAANFTGSYNPTFQLTGLSGTQTADIDWGYTAGTYGNSAVAGASGATVTTGAQNVTTNVTDTSVGVSIYIRVTVYNHGFEGIANENISLAVEAVDSALPTPNKDVTASCAVGTGYEDIAMQTLNARPTVTPGTTMLPQIP